MGRLKIFRQDKRDHYRNIIFGLEDGFVSTAGVMFGIATATNNQNFILIAGIITVLVEATSMGAGAYLSEKSSQELVENKLKPIAATIDGLIMFLAYTLAGTICVLPYAFLNPGAAKGLSITITLTGLFLIGYLPKRKFDRGLEVFLLAGLAIFIGYLAGEVLQSLT